MPNELAERPMSFLDRAIEKGVGAEELGKLVDLYRQLEADKQRAAFHAAMVAAQGEMPVVVRDARNAQTGSTYATLDMVFARCKPILFLHGLAVTFTEAATPIPEHKRTVMSIRHVMGHTEEVYVDLPLDGVGPKGAPIGGMNRVQAAVSTGSYGERVAFCRGFAIVIADTDTDGQQQNGFIDKAQADTVRQQFIRAGYSDDDLPRFLAWVFNLPIDKLTKDHSIERITTSRFPAVADMLQKAVNKKERLDKAKEAQPA